MTRRSPTKLRGITTVFVQGASMEPALQDGNWLLVHWGARRISPGNIVVIEREAQPGIFYIKRVSEVRNNSEYFVTSDNPLGTDSRQWGWLTADEIIGKSLGRIKK